MTMREDYDDTVQDPEEGKELPAGLHLWAVLDGNWGFIAEGRAGDFHHAWATMIAVMRLQPASVQVHGLLRDGEDGRLVRFERVGPGCYRELRT